MIPDNWSIACIMDAYAEEKAKLEKDYGEEADKLEAIYCAAMKILFKQGYGDVFTVDNFIAHVACGGFIDYDGIGYFANIEGEEKQQISCDEKWLQAHRGDYPFVIWYNK